MAWIASDAALALLGVKPQTLYANVSRGRIATKPDPADPRRRLYKRADVLRLADRAVGRPRAGAVAEEAIAWGEPVLPSALSTIAEGRLWYRGRDAVALARSASLEDAAALLWDAGEVVFQAGARVTAAAGHRGMGGALLTLAGIAEQSLPSRDRAPAVLRAEAAQLVDSLVAGLLGGDDPGRGPAHQRLAKAWRRPKAAEAMRMALVLLADHELNASTFAARVTASTGASIAASVLSGLATLSGPLHGGAAAGVRALVADAAASGPREAVRSWLAQGRRLAAFGHPLYPAGDVRAAALLDGLVLPPLHAALMAEAEAAVGEPANVDFALAALAAAHGLPDEAAFTLFAVARSVGWIAHCLEQAALNRLIRPRSRYVGPPIAAGDGEPSLP
jgi:citrate synthase